MVAFTYLRSFWVGATKPYSVVDRLQSIEVPDDAPPDLWYVAELRRSVALLQTVNQARSLDIIQGVIGVFLALLGLGAAAHLLVRWNEGPRKALLARVLRWHLGESTTSADPQAAD
jgi:hypothetical protein